MSDEEERLKDMVCGFEGSLGLETPFAELILDRLQACINHVSEAS